MTHHNVANTAEDEAVRIEILHKYEILDTPPDGTFDRITKLAAQLLDVPIAIVSLVDTDRIWFKSRHGLEVHEIPRDPGLCSSAILSDDIYIVEDARNDPRSLANPLVAGDFGLQFYSASPLKTREGFNLGTLCVIDRKPRSLSESEKQILKSLGELVMNQIELQLEARIAVRHHHQILNTTAHDLKNPVAIMPLLADLIMENKDNPAAIDDISRQIKEAGRRMSQTINVLLESAMDNSGNIPLRMEAFDFGKLIEGIVKANQALARKKRQKITFVPEVQCTVFADHRRITEVVDNLVNNAIKYSYQGKTIKAILRRKDDHAVLEIRDEGQGLSKDDLKNLFRRFTSLSAKPTGGEISTGLGLSISKEVVQAHRGALWARSDGKGKGSSFFLELPLAEEE